MQIPDSEIEELKRIGTVEILIGKIEDVESAEKFKTFIKRNI